MSKRLLTYLTRRISMPGSESPRRLFGRACGDDVHDNSPNGSLSPFRAPTRNGHYSILVDRSDYRIRRKRSRIPMVLAQLSRNEKERVA